MELLNSLIHHQNHETGNNTFTPEELPPMPEVVAETETNPTEPEKTTDGKEDSPSFNLLKHHKQTEDEEQSRAKYCCDVLKLEYFPEKAEASLLYLEQAVKSKQECENCNKIGALQACCIRFGVTLENDQYYPSMGPCPQPPHLGKFYSAEPTPDEVGIPSHYRGKNFDNFTVNSFNEDAFKYCINWAERYIPKTLGMILVGPSNSGKTHLIAGVIDTLLAKRIPCKFTSIPKILEQIRLGVINKAVDNTEFLTLLKEIEVLIIDDIQSQGMSSWAKRQIYDIINHRYENDLTTIFSTNENSHDLKAHLGVKLAQRMREMAPVVAVHDTPRTGVAEENYLNFNN